jgi:hypothetical protein
MMERYMQKTAIESVMNNADAMRKGIHSKESR